MSSRNTFSLSSLIGKLFAGDKMWESEEREDGSLYRGLMPFIQRHAQTLDRFAAKNVAFNDLVNVFDGHPLIPNSFGVNNYGRPAFTSIETSGLIGAHYPFQAAAMQLFFEFIRKGFRAFRRAASFRIIRRALVGADENVIVETFHESRVTGFMDCWITGLMDKWIDGLLG